MNYNSTFSRKKRTKYQFVSTRDIENFQNTEDNEIKSLYYQVCTFPEPKTGRFHMRKFIINNNNEFIDIKNFKLTKKQCKQFCSTTKPHQYKKFNTYDLENVSYPCLADILTSQSNILSTDYTYSGFAPF